jgi:phage shock protein E
MQKKSIVLIFVALLFQINCAHQGFSKQVENIIEKKSISASELKDLIDRKDNGYILIDVRSEEEYNSGHIPTSVNIPHTKIQEETAKIPKEKLIIVYCKVGGRAGIAENKFIELGYQNVINFGGINSWNYEVEK